MFNRGDYKFVAAEPAEETLWLLGPAACRNWISCRRASRQVDRKDSQTVAITSCVTVGPRKQIISSLIVVHHGADNCGHAHADALSFELAVNGQTMLIDPGTYTYTASKDLRDSFRSSSAHNTLTVDDRSWSTPSGPFSWQSIGDSRELIWNLKGAI